MNTRTNTRRSTWIQLNERRAARISSMRASKPTNLQSELKDQSFRQFKHLLAIQASVLLLCPAALGADPTFSDADWVGLGSGMNNEVDALAVSGTDLYAGGQFTTAGGVPANYIAKWNGSVFSPLGLGISGQTLSLTLDRFGNLFAGGNFTSAGEVAAGDIAKWNGSAWAYAGLPGMNNPVFALTADASGNLYVGGEFTTAGGVNVNDPAVWNGTNWSTLGSGIGEVRSFAFDNSGNLYAGGAFTTPVAGGVYAINIAEWTGSSWSALGSGVGDQVNSIGFDRSGNLYAGGNFTTAGGADANHVAEWNGSAWTQLASGMNGQVSSLVFDNSGNLYAGGFFTQAGVVSANNIAKWNGRSWSALGSGMNGLVSTLVFDNSGNLYAGGIFTTAGGVSANNIAKWNGTNWSTLGSGMNNVDLGIQSIVNSLVFDNSGNLYAGGNFTQAGGVSANNIAKWNGTNWSALGSGIGAGGPTVIGPTFLSINALAFDNLGNLYAGGYFNRAGAITSEYIAEAILAGTTAPLAIIANNAAFGFTNGSFGFDVSGPSGSNVVIQASADLKTWIPLQTNLLGSGPLYFSNAATNHQGFYRTVLLP